MTANINSFVFIIIIIVVVVVVVKQCNGWLRRYFYQIVIFSKCACVASVYAVAYHMENSMNTSWYKYR